MSFRNRRAESALERTLSALEDHMEQMPDADIEFLDELGRLVLAGGTILTLKEQARLDHLEREYLE